MFLVGYHAGVGHLTLPFNDLRRYFDNPTGYAAEKCGISEPAYRRWLEHYENPVCRAPGKKTGRPVASRSCGSVSQLTLSPAFMTVVTSTRVPNSPAPDNLFQN